MKKHLHDYLRGKQYSGIYLIGTGFLTATIGALPFLFALDAFFQGLQAALLPFSIVEFGRGAMQWGFVVRNRARLSALLWEAPRQFYEQEQRRIAAERKFNYRLRFLTLVILACGLGFALLGSVGNLGPFTTGTGVGLSLQTALLLVNDLFAGMRQGIYAYFLQRFSGGSGD
ncbi:MAG: hypothetical protein KDC32_01625 [Saprospiraceae bacterium]|nr:hypothetical protein [Saprospiraceae bacterium]